MLIKTDILLLFASPDQSIAEAHLHPCILALAEQSLRKVNPNLNM